MYPFLPLVLYHGKDLDLAHHKIAQNITKIVFLASQDDKVSWFPSPGAENHRSNLRVTKRTMMVDGGRERLHSRSTSLLVNSHSPRLLSSLSSHLVILLTLLIIPPTLPPLPSSSAEYVEVTEGEEEKEGDERKKERKGWRK